jgi:hypothetical protein
MTNLLQEHFDQHLSLYGETRRKQDGPRVIRNAYSKRIHLFKKIQVQAHRCRSEEDFMRGKVPKAAAALDSRRAGKSLNESIRHEGT